MGKVIEKGDVCRHCPHVFDDHPMVATTGDPLKGGVTVCQVIGCECYSTWGVNIAGVEQGVERIPDRFELTAIRERVQTVP